MATTSNLTGTTPAQPSIHPQTSIGHVHLKVADLPRANTVFAELFPTEPPARVTIQVHPQVKERIRVGLIAAR